MIAEWSRPDGTAASSAPRRVGVTRIAVERREGRHRTRLTSGLLRPQAVRSRDGECRIGLLATTALLLGGDAVELCVDVAPGASLALFDVAGTVAFDGRGRSACWDVRIRLAEGAHLSFRGEPLIVADGADVARSLTVELAADATALIRESLVLGRTGQLGGRLRNRTAVSIDGRPVLIEDTELDSSALRTRPGMLGHHRVVDTITSLGRPATAVQPVGLAQFTLHAGSGTVTRFLGSGLADSPVHAEWRRLTTPSELP